MKLIVNAESVEELIETLRGISAMIAEGYNAGYDGSTTWELMGGDEE